MISAVEKQKFVYILNRDAAARLTISSPLEAHKGGLICYGITGLDVGKGETCVQIERSIGWYFKG